MTKINLISNYRRSFLILLLLITFTSSYSQSNKYQQGVIYVRIAPHSQQQFFNLFGDNNTIANYSITKIEQPFNGGDSTISRIYRLHFDASIPQDNLIKILEQYPFIEYAEKIPVYRISFVPNDPLYLSHQYNLLNVNAKQAWDICKGSPSVVIAVVDNAININHQDLEANIWTNPNVDPQTYWDVADGYLNDIHGWNVADSNNNPNPPTGINASSDWNHGTHVSGIASAATNNGLGIASLGYSCKIMALRCAPENSSGDNLTVPYDGVFYAVINKANVINMSFEASAPDSTDQSIIKYAYNAGVVCIAAAGNDTSATPVYPATYPNVIGVGATDQNDRIASFSNYGPNATVMAPGWDIYSTFGYADNAYGYLYGTSMASPLVCGLAGLIISENPKLNPDQVKYYIQAGCDNIDLMNPAFIGQMGSGRINAYKSLQLVQQDSNNYNSNNVINVFPNPSTNTCNLRFNQRCVNASFEIIIHNLLGQKVYDEIVPNFSGFLYPLNLISLAQGVYITQIILPNTTYNTIIVKGQNE
jgi:serine protease